MRSFFIHKFLIFIILVCSFGMLTTLMLAFNHSAYRHDVAWRKPLVGSVFAIICIAGIFAAVFPKTCLNIIGHHGTDKKIASVRDTTERKVTIKGHHFDCDNFSNHIVQIRGSVMCAACCGLTIGALIALVGTVAYFFLGVNLIQANIGIVLIGEAALTLGLAEFKLRGYLRLSVNIIFVLGGFMTLVGADSLTENLLVDFYLIGVIIACILARILISQWNHWRTCHLCKELCEIDKTEKEF